jgi:hypothetical protein
MLNSLIEKLKLVKDFRRNQGKRHQLWVVLTIIIFALLVVSQSYFCELIKFRKIFSAKYLEFEHPQI